jgi:hypothetical protein
MDFSAWFEVYLGGRWLNDLPTLRSSPMRGSRYIKSFQEHILEICGVSQQ